MSQSDASGDPRVMADIFLTRIYFAFLRRPLQAWEYINSAAAKCQLLLSYTTTPEQTEEQERIRRIFWSCYVLER